MFQEITNQKEHKKSKEIKDPNSKRKKQTRSSKTTGQGVTNFHSFYRLKKCLNQVKKKEIKAEVDKDQEEEGIKSDMYQ